jgi:hypothetical protein
MMAVAPVAVIRRGSRLAAVWRAAHSSVTTMPASVRGGFLRARNDSHRATGNMGRARNLAAPSSLAVTAHQHGGVKATHGDTADKYATGGARCAAAVSDTAAAVSNATTAIRDAAAANSDAAAANSDAAGAGRGGRPETAGCAAPDHAAVHLSQDNFTFPNATEIA